MRIYTAPPQQISNRFIEEFPASSSDSTGAAFEEAMFSSPSYSLYRAYELGQAMGDESDAIMEADRAREIVAGFGLENDLNIPDGGIRGGALDILIDRKRQEIRRRSVQQRSESTFLDFGAGLGASLLDPLNVASAFIPAVGPARYASMLARETTALGRAGVRARVGAVEGAFGAALVEPIVYGAASYEQADYDLTDSMLNIAFGTVMGGGLHMGLGAATDAIRKGRAASLAEPQGDVARNLNDLPFADREAILKTAVNQLAEGRAVDIEPLLMMSRARLRDTVSLTGMTPDRALSPAERADIIARAEQPGTFRRAEETQAMAESLTRREEALAARAGEMTEQERSAAQRLREIERELATTDDARKIRRLERNREEALRPLTPEQRQRVEAASAEPEAVRGSPTEQRPQAMPMDALREQAAMQQQSTMQQQAAMQSAFRQPAGAEPVRLRQQVQARRITPDERQLVDEVNRRVQQSEGRAETLPEVEREVSELTADIEDMASRLGIDVDEGIRAAAGITEEAVAFVDSLRALVACGARKG